MKTNWIFFLGALLLVGGIYFMVRFSMDCEGTVVRGLWGLECIPK